ncbi:MAG: SpoIIE family protein phosphatase [Bryobacteraceae bacterium]|jgi:sigma-B regulation protein RsbU (phosphoserine phosphatase)|nr:SpoIIE family protein phosphatase [Bryobacteraceae bacterium]
MSDSAQAATRFRQRSELLDFLLEVAAVTSETLDLDRLLANVADIVRKVVPFELFAILLYSEKRNELRIRYAIGHREEVVRNLRIPLGQGITGAAAERREPVLVGDVRKDPRYLNAVDVVRSELAVPMVARNKLVGVIDIQSTRLNAYGEYERSMLRLIASRVASAIDNARLYRRVERQNRTLRTLARLSQEFSSTLSLDDVLARIAEGVRSLIPYDSFSVLLVDEQRRLLRHRFSYRYDERARLDNLPLGKGITGAAVEAREVIKVDDTLADPRYIPSHPDIRSEVAVPLIARGRVIGVMDLESEHIGFFTEDHVRTLSLLAPQVANSVENARLYEELAERERRMEQDLAAARELQLVLLPKQAPEIEGLETAVGLRPARQVSGDLYDFFVHNHEHVLIAAGDVSGKGAPAALYGAMVSGLLRTLAPQTCRPAALMQSLNQALIERRVDARYVTLLVLLWEPSRRALTMANAGSLPPLICREGQILRPRAEGIPLGLLETQEYEETAFATRPGDVVVIYSDGVVDQQNAAGEEYGKRRLTEVLERNWREPPARLVEAVFRSLDAFADGSEISDDQTLLVLRVR